MCRPRRRMQGTIKGKQSKVPLFDDIAFSQRDFGAEVSCARRAQEARRQSDQAPARVPGNTVLAVDAHLERFFK